MTRTLKPLPSGQGSFEELRKHRMAYVDKTKAIESLEDPENQFSTFLRPRRFGKTLFSTTLFAYYDKSFADRFDQLFAGTYIHQHPTAARGQYYVLFLDFSAISPGEILSGFKAMVQGSVANFIDRYPEFAGCDFNLAEDSAPGTYLIRFFTAIRSRLNAKVFVIIDEYDCFANDILAADKDAFKELTSSESFFKAFYQALKALNSAFGIVERIFITGVTPISIDSITSGFNIQNNLSTDPDFADAVGFTEAEVRQLIEESVDLEKAGLSENSVLQHMKEFYNGYFFSPESGVSVYNTAMCLSYLRELRKRGKEPSPLSQSFSADLYKIDGILSLGRPEFLKETIDKIVSGDKVQLRNDLYSPINLSATGRFSDNDVLATLYYLGYLTCDRSSAKTLVCPNRVGLERFFRYYFLRLHGSELFFDKSEMTAPYEELAKGNLFPLLEFVSKTLTESSGVHIFTHFDEMALQIAIRFAMIGNPQYEVTLEEEARGSGYCDLIFRAKAQTTGLSSYVLELKYLKKSSSDEQITEALSEAKAQLARYSAVEPVQSLKNAKKFAVVFCGLDTFKAQELIN